MVEFCGIARLVSCYSTHTNYVYCAKKSGNTQFIEILETFDMWLTRGSGVVDIWPRCDHHVIYVELVWGSYMVYNLA